MAHLPWLLPFFFLLLGVHGSFSHGSPLPSYYDPSICLKSSMCGDVNISYPFYLSEATAENSNYESYFCGYTGLKITCQDNENSKSPIIQLGKDNYTIKNISYNNHVVELVDSDAVLGGKCTRIRHNVTFGQTDEWLQYTKSNEELTFFLGCYSGARGLRAPPPGFDRDVYEISCLGFDPPDTGISFVFTPDEQKTYEEYALAESCNEVFVVPIQKDLLETSDQFKLSNFTNGGYGDVLKQGFELAWNLSLRDPCHLCEQSDGGRCAYNESRVFLGCLCSDRKVGVLNCSSSGRASTPSPSSDKNRKTQLIAGVGGGFAALVVAGLIITILFVRKRKQKKKVTSSSKLLKYSGSGGTPRSGMGSDLESGSIQDMKMPHFSYEELEEATDSFNDSRELGDGGFGTVYKGNLRDGRVVAVKRLYNNSYRRVEQFVNEAAILSRVRHPNLVMFYGCTSSQSRELLLVYEFVQNGTVADHLHGHRAPERALPWPLRLNIAVESAAALTYLHAIEPPIMHRDVKTNNILLDGDFHVKVADFGLSRLFPLDVTHVSTAPQGTPGYVDPEYHQCYQLTEKSDVYSFGVVLVELISSKTAVDITRHRNEINLAGMAINKIQKCQLEQLVDLELGYDSDPATKKMMTMVAELAFRCLQQNGEMRPPMKEVLDVLRGIQEGCVEKTGDKDKSLVAPFSPDTVHAPWDSRKTTPNTSQ